ncbi:hypothetical protein D9611_002356 [Ephemerocybe angulata]|uniref:Uncharacterized protein n=1 Tax=Ephemerocybe angulata TaxID=980116 RepID=A0A8H5C1Z0_9AGAR|nr:hypothetical protein D9611_002356 [Tulosesus angulatus]
MSTFIKNTSPTIAKRIEKDIANEAVKEDKSVKHALKELAHLEKQDNKAHKKVDKGTRALGKADQKEESTLHALNKQTKRHDDAVVELSRRSRELEALKAQEAKLDTALAQKKIIVEDAIKQKDMHEQDRLRRLEEAGGFRNANNTTMPEAQTADSEEHPDPRQLH